MYFPDNFAGLAALSEHVHRFVLRWRTAARGRADDRFIHSQDRRRNTGSASSQEQTDQRQRGENGYWGVIGKPRSEKAKA